MAAHRGQRVLQEGLRTAALDEDVVDPVWIASTGIAEVTLLGLGPCDRIRWPIRRECLLRICRACSVDPLIDLRNSTFEDLYECIDVALDHNCCRIEPVLLSRHHRDELASPADEISELAL